MPHTCVYTAVVYTMIRLPHNFVVLHRDSWKHESTVGDREGLGRQGKEEPMLPKARGIRKPAVLATREPDVNNRRRPQDARPRVCNG